MKQEFNQEEINYSSKVEKWKDHPAKIINEAMKATDERRKMTKGSVSFFVGHFIPNLTTYTLLITSIYFMIKYFQKYPDIFFFLYNKLICF